MTYNLSDWLELFNTTFNIRAIHCLLTENSLSILMAIFQVNLG